MILFFDTETTGFYRPNDTFDSLLQPRLVQLAFLLTDEEGQTINSASLIVNPGIPIPDQASAVHGISDAKAAKYGIHEKSAFSLFQSMLKKASVAVAHNSKFDVGIMNCAGARAGLDVAWPAVFCTMETATPILNLPPTERMIAAGFNRPKAPKLEECIKHFFNEKLDGAHDAMVDVVACKRVYFHLKGWKEANNDK